MANYNDKSASSLFKEKKYQEGAFSKVLTSESLETLGSKVESAGYVRAELENKDRVVPTIDFSLPRNFAKYGSAEEYYKTSIERIYKTYPYDGSKKEKIQWSLSSSYLDNYIFENEYPRTNGYVMFERTGSDGESKTVSGVGAIAATAEIKFSSFPFEKPNPSTYVTIKSSSGTEKTYRFFPGPGMPATGTELTLTYTGLKYIVVNIHGMTTAAQWSEELKNAINSAKGNNAGTPDSVIKLTFPTTLSIKLTQVVKGEAGNKPITTVGSHIEAEGFFGGVDGSDEIYGLAASPQYISVKGGANKASLPVYEQGLNKTPDFKKEEHKANIYDVSSGRDKNITINGNTGNTIEFWLNSHESVNRSRCIFDVWNNDGTENTQIESASYGRIMVESRVAGGSPVDNSLLHFTYMSGSDGVFRIPLLSISDVSFSTDSWNHYAISVKNTSDSKLLSIKSFFNGKLVDSKVVGTSIGEVTGSSLGGIDANINAYANYPSEEIKGHCLGVGTPITDFNSFGTNSGSVDEVRFWKSARTEEQIGLNWFTNIGAGTNTDTANTDLGFYFKFNEGIVGDSTIDKTILDYSGRVSNGVYNNYSSKNRSTGSAIVLGGAAEKEFKDPILYPQHSSVIAYQESALEVGREWDYSNPSYLFNSLPSWIQEEDNDFGGNTKILTQIMASYFDTLHLQIEEMNKLKTVRYMTSDKDTNIKPIPFSSKLLINSGFPAPEIFANTDILAALMNKDENMEYERKIYDIKNYIYQNIYNNMTYINKSKGTLKSIRNLIRCFGVGEEIYKVNMYADNAEYTLTDNFEEKSIRKTYADFNHITRNNATVYTYKNSSESNNFGFITGSTKTSTGFDRGMAMTLQAEVILPKKPEFGESKYEEYFFGYPESSLFGMHSAKIDPEKDSDDQTVMTWDANDYANFQVYASLKSYNDVLPELTSSLFLDQYQGTKWNFAVRVKPEAYPYASEAANNPITGSTTGKNYKVEFEGYSTVSNVVQNSFLATGTISQTAGERFMVQKKRVYVGAHRTNFTGSLREPSDAMVSSCRYWAEDITSEELKAHAIDTTSYGIQNPEKNAYLFVTKNNPSIEVPRINTLIMNWEFDTVKASNDSGQFVVKDSSYTINQDLKRQLWERDLSNLLDTNHDARGDFFEINNSGSVRREHIQSYKQQIPENINNSNMISVSTTDDLTFTKNTLPVKFSFSLEKSMNQTISEEMIKFFYASKEASSLENLLGDPINRYRMNYKLLEKTRSVFFNTIGNVPNLEKYFNYYKWFDDSIGEMVKSIVPASSNKPQVRNVIESHMLERGGKYQSKFPSIDKKMEIIEGTLEGSGA